MNHIHSGFDAHRAVWALWPSSLCSYRDEAVPLQKSFARFVAAVSMHTPVFVAVSEKEYERARFIIPKHITMYKMDCDGVYADDLHVHFVYEEGVSKVVAGADISGRAVSVLNSFSNYHRINFSEKKFLSLPEFETDGKGTFVILQSDLNSYGLPLESLRKAFEEFGCVHRIMLIRDTDFPDIQVQSVTDLLRFVGPGIVVLNHVPNDEKNPFYMLLNHAFGLFSGERDSEGREYVIKTVPFGRYEGAGYAAYRDRGFKYSVVGSYLNFLITNQSVVVPLINPENDNQILIEMQNGLGSLGFDVNGVDAGDLYANGLDFKKLVMPVYR